MGMALILTILAFSLALSLTNHRYGAVGSQPTLSDLSIADRAATLEGKIGVPQVETLSGPIVLETARVVATRGLNLPFRSPLSDRKLMTS
jgi:hypothetical protein